ncbi:hypothetical protein TNCV_4867121 [Trichonephila clavipes]|nr:hypothetical protein TNCV_4867121 [Trichonephila clavipes]
MATSRFTIAKCSAHAKTINSVETAPICSEKTDVLYTYKQLPRRTGGITHDRDKCHHRQLRIACGDGGHYQHATWHEDVSISRRIESFKLTMLRIAQINCGFEESLKPEIIGV